MLCDFQNKILNFKDYTDIDKLIDGLETDNLTFPLTYFDINKQKTIKSSTLLKLDNSYLLFDLLIQDKYPELRTYFQEINSRTSFNEKSETDEQFLTRLESIKEIKKTFFRVYNKIKIYKGTKSFFDFIIRFFLKMKYNLSDYEIEINLYETGPFSYLITANLSTFEFEFVIKPIVHPNGWFSEFQSINQLSDKIFFQNKICNIKKQLDFNSIESTEYETVSFKKNFIRENVSLWTAETNYKVGDWVWLPARISINTNADIESGNGRIFKCVSLGKSGIFTPLWDNLIEDNLADSSLNSIPDGTVIWRCYMLKNKLFSPITVKANESANLNDFGKTLPYFFTTGYLENQAIDEFYCEFNINENDLLLTNTFEITFSERVDLNLINIYAEVRVNDVLVQTTFEEIAGSNNKIFKIVDSEYQTDVRYTITIGTKMRSLATNKYLSRKFEINFTGVIPEYYLANSLPYTL